jgi:hypothetical protein
VAVGRAIEHDLDTPTRGGHCQPVTVNGSELSLVTESTEVASTTRR